MSSEGKDKKEYYHHSGEKRELKYCDCGHCQLDHDFWGSGGCGCCDCEEFKPKGT